MQRHGAVRRLLPPAQVLLWRVAMSAPDTRRRLHVVMQLSTPGVKLEVDDAPVRMVLPDGMVGFLPVYDDLAAARRDYPTAEIFVAVSVDEEG